MRRAAKVDGNHVRIKRLLEAYGAKVKSLASVGDGILDQLVWFGGRTFLAEIKDGTKPPGERQLTAKQIEFVADWPGEKHLLECDEDVPVALGVPPKPLAWDAKRKVWLHATSATKRQAEDVPKVLGVK